ncbi:MAG: hypothetical protein Q9219_002493 [cf. Caloplaca sp. 3 TL-2023]
MLFSITRSYFAVALLCTSSLADAVAIAFGNPAFAGITFGQPFTITWFGGDGTPVQVDLLTGNPAKLLPVATLASNYSGTAISWTPILSEFVLPGGLYALSIVQSGLTNYSPMFGIQDSASRVGQVHAAHNAPVPMGTGRYYPVVKRVEQDNARVLNSDLGFFGSGAIVPRHYTTGIDHPADYITYTGTESPVTYTFIYPTGSGSGSTQYMGTGTGAPYPTGTSTGSGTNLRGAAVGSQSPISAYDSGSEKLSLSWVILVKSLASGIAAMLLWT